LVRRRIKGFCKEDQQLGIQRIGLAGLGRGFGEVPHSPRVDHGHGKDRSQLFQLPGEGSPVGPGGFHHDLQLELSRQPLVEGLHTLSIQVKGLGPKALAKTLGGYKAPFGNVHSNPLDTIHDVFS